MWTYAVTDSIRRNQSPRSDYCLMFVYTGYITIKPEMHPCYCWAYGIPWHGTRCGVGPKKTTNWKLVKTKRAITETHAKLLRGAGWWLDPIDGLAKVVLAIKADRRQPRITIQRWQYDSAKTESENVPIIEIRKQ
ncbi:hypothetical protein N7530_001289 [Penicillium desertorum]|uniref:Uncharacterized protein n=1 Tax=Penicillium desertorum TaxID=1303715 RepID=A0A9X0BW67_9EURO|nr:hypothetical protein N7530_001289 [Penicillium desertorum]